MLRYFFFSLIILQATLASGQINIAGKVGTGENFSPLPMASIYILNTSIGTYTDSLGNFKIESPTNIVQLVVSYVGFSNDTILIDKDSPKLKIRLHPNADLKAVEISGRRSSTNISKIDMLKTESLGEEELKKAPCCNLAESFETNPTVDLSYTDALMGTRQIEMLGLSGKYTLISHEIIPKARLIGTSMGLNFVPGPWLESIQVAKGSGSVKNGPESMTGQINYEIKKPEDCSKKDHFLNVFWNISGRTELNYIGKHEFSNKWSTAILVHGNIRKVRWDINSNGFLDAPLQDQINIMNRWKYQGTNGLEAMFGVWYVRENKIGGQLNYRSNQTINVDSPFGYEQFTSKFTSWAKIGYVFENSNKSIGLQLSNDYYTQDAIVGLKSYNAISSSSYANLMFQNEIFGDDNLLTLGISGTFDVLNEEISLFNNNFDRQELTVGPHFEYHYFINKKLSVLGGLRYDLNNFYGGFLSPRLYFKWDPNANWSLRASAGRGSRTANIFIENFSMLANGRQWQMNFTGNENTPYGLDRESSWNFGVNLTKNFTLDFRDGFVTMDLYRVEFENQIVLDLEQSATELSLYNLQGRSYSNNFQFTFDYELLKFLDIRLAYRYMDVQTQYISGMNTPPLISKHRGFINLAYETSVDRWNGKWLFDFTPQWYDKQRLPGGFTYRAADQKMESPDYWMLNAQITRTWKKDFEIYSGVENILDFRLDNPILNPQNPYSDTFDATQIWGPIFGRMIYAGIRFSF